MSNVVEVKRGRGRPKSFPELSEKEVKMAGYKLLVTTLEVVSKGAEKRGIAQNALVNRALLAYLRKG